MNEKMNQKSIQLSDRCLATLDRIIASFEAQFLPDSIEHKAYLHTIRQSFKYAKADTAAIEAIKDKASRAIVCDAVMNTFQAYLAETETK